MSTGLPPKERDRIVEEQRIRTRETFKYSLKMIGKVYLIGGGIFLLALCCMCIFLAVTSTTILNNFGY